jgi:hypothetical protein
LLGTLHNRVANLRWLTKALGKDGLVLDLVYYGIDPVDSTHAGGDTED